MKSPEHLHEIFAKSEYGAKLNTSIRFADFKPTDIDAKLWVDMLGDDVNNLLHMPHTHRLAQRFSKEEGLTELQTKTMLLTAMTHDWGEAITGDIAYPSKSEQDEIDEEIAYRTIAEELLGKYEGEELADQVWEVLSQQETEMGGRFKAIEYLGYNTTAMRAGYTGRAVAARLVKLDLTRPQTEHLAGGLIGFEATMQSLSYFTLAQCVEKYPGIQTIIREGVPYKAVEVSTVE